MMDNSKAIHLGYYFADERKCRFSSQLSGFRGLKFACGKHPRDCNHHKRFHNGSRSCTDNCFRHVSGWYPRIASHIQAYGLVGKDKVANQLKDYDFVAINCNINGDNADIKLEVLKNSPDAHHARYLTAIDEKLDAKLKLRKEKKLRLKRKQKLEKQLRKERMKQLVEKRKKKKLQPKLAIQDSNSSQAETSLVSILEQRGIQPNYTAINVPLHQHPSIIAAGQLFFSEIRKAVDGIYHCPLCKERNLETRRSLKRGSKEAECEKCFESRNNNKIDGRSIRIMTKENFMDPFPNGFPYQIFKLNLTPIEEMLISPVIAVFKVYQLSSGTQKYQGNAINFEQDILEFAQSLPRRVQDLPVTIMVRKSNPVFPDGYKDFKVNRAKIVKALEYLVDQNPSLFCNIDSNAIESLPENGSVQSLIPVTTEESIEKMLSQVSGSQPAGEQSQEQGGVEVNGDDGDGDGDDECDDDDGDDDGDADSDDDEAIRQHGPEQGGATGIPINEQHDMKENYIPQPLQQRMDALCELQKTVGIDIGD